VRRQRAKTHRVVERRRRAHYWAADQITQLRGFADQRLRKPDAPLDPANRRISVIVQYILKNADDDDGTPGGDKERPRQ
jgi:flagellar motor protein MotB